MTDKKAAKEFVKRWRSILAEVPAGKNNEQQDTQKFWIDLLVNVLGVPAASVTGYVDFERCAQAVLDARDGQDGATLADMYDPDNETFFPELTEAHRKLDAAVEAAYGVDFGGDENEIVAHLFGLYSKRIDG